MSSLARRPVDVSLVTYNSERWLTPLLESLLTQTTGTGHLSLLVRDNGSQDGTLTLLAELRARFAARFTLFEVDADGRNLGFGAGHNRNLARGRADLFLVLNTDLELAPDALAHLESEVQAAPEDVAAWELRQAPYEHPKDYNPVTGETHWCSGAAVLLRRRALQALGGFDERIFLYGEDVDLSWRLRNAGFRLLYVPRAVATHHAYAEPHEVKPRQFLGSTLANLYLRTRFGTTPQLLAGLARYLLLLAQREMFPGQRRGLLRNLLRYLRHAPYFRRGHRYRRLQPSFYGWDYSFMRDGAFHPLPAPFARTDEPRVSILVRTCGRPAVLREALLSAFRQTHSKLEVVVVEDGPPRAQAMIAREFAMQPMTYLALGINRGRCAAGNEALALATGEYFVFLDDDDLLYADHVEVLLDAVRRRHTRAAYALALEVPTSVHSLEPYQYTEATQNVHVAHRQRFSRAVLWHHNYMPVQSVLFHRSLYEELGGFDPELENFEDWDLWTRYSLANDFAYVPKVTSRYRVPADPEEQARRQRSRDRYHEAVRQKQEGMRLVLNPADVLRWHEELNEALNVVTISRADIRRWVAHYVPGQHNYAVLRDRYRRALRLAVRRRPRGTPASAGHL